LEGDDFSLVRVGKNNEVESFPNFFPGEFEKSGSERISFRGVIMGTAQAGEVISGFPNHSGRKVVG